MMIKTAMLIWVSLLLTPPSHAGQEELAKRIAIASEGKTTDSKVGDRAARCKYFLIFDEEGQLIEVLDNPHRNAPGGAGRKTAGLMAQKGVTLIVAGKFGYKMIDALETNEIAHLEFSGTVKKALERALERQE
jgi:predicted Fe-Mo cluster-binding NifX family protein